jgi:hypothetical protein
MERKRIIIEADGGSDIDERLSKIEVAINDLKDKLSNKWFMPLLLVFITASMTAANYLITRHFSNGDIYGNKLKEKIAELRATQTLDFYNQSIANLDTLNRTFHGICQFGTSESDIKKFNRVIVRLEELKDKQLTVDTLVIKTLNEYNFYLADKETDIEGNKVASADLGKIYKRSEVLYQQVIQQINSSLNSLTER